MSDGTDTATGQEEVGALDRFDKPTMNAIQAAELARESGITRAMFVPQSYAEAIEIAKMMCAGVGVPAYLRGSPANCMAILMQASRWGLDPYAVASDSYCVNDIIAYGAKLVNAVVTTSGALNGRLKIWWTGEGNNLRCYVEGHIKGDDERKLLSQAIARVKTKKSPLWEVNPEQQLAYFTTRAWARLYIPEVLLGVFSADDIIDGVVAPPSGRPVESPNNPMLKTLDPARAAPRRSDFEERGAAEPTQDEPAREQVEKDTASPKPREVGPVPEGFETWEAWADDVVSRMKVAPSLPRLEAVTGGAKPQYDEAPDEIRALLDRVYEEKATDHREAMR